MFGGLIEKVLRRRGLTIAPVRKRDTIIKSDFYNVEPEFLDLANRFPANIVARDYAYYKAVKYVIDAGIQGDIVECGVLRGRGAAILAGAMGDSDKRLWLYDVFEDDPRRRPAADEIYLPLNVPARELWDDVEGPTKSPSLPETMNKLAQVEFASDRAVIVKGLVQETIPQRVPSAISLLKINTDYDESVAHCLEHLFPLLSPGGFLSVEAYGRYSHARTALDGYLCRHNIKRYLHRVDDSMHVLIK
jgi:O-methyltransferase